MHSISETAFIKALRTNVFRAHWHFSWLGLIIQCWFMAVFPIHISSCFSIGNKENPVATTSTVEKQFISPFFV